MPRKKFLADLDHAPQELIPNIHDVCKGEDDGQVVFLWTSAYSDLPVKVYASFEGPGDYPTSHDCYVYAAHDAPAAVAKKLHDGLPDLRRKSLSDVLRAVSSISNEPITSDEDDEMFSEADSEEYEEDMDYVSSRVQGNSRQPIPARGIEGELKNRLNIDLQHLRTSGFHVGFHGSILQASSSMVSISRRIKHLGLSQEALKAWSLQADDYLVLLVRYPHGYQSLEHLTSSKVSTHEPTVDLRVGLSPSHKPSREDAFAAFDQTRDTRPKDGKQSHSTFEDTFISRPLNDLINTRLLKLLDFRFRGMTWAEAEQQYTLLEDEGASLTVETTTRPAGRIRDEDSAEDHLSQSGPHSFLLTAMQFTLRHFLHCTKFCLVCHRKLSNDFEALKPYVCERSLCLYQYMTLGFGPRIEHEIISQPMVADLLVSFCYKAAFARSLTEFPEGLSIVVPACASAVTSLGSGVMIPSHGTVPQGTIKINLSVDQGKAHAGSLAGTPCPFRLGDWVICQTVDGLQPAFHCRITEITYWPTLKFDAPVKTPVFEDGHATKNTAKKPAAKKAAKVKDARQEMHSPEMYMQKYDVLFDSLPKDGKQDALMMLLDTLPAIDELKVFLETGHKDLQQYHSRVSPSALAVLRWIIASNRACILHVPIPEPTSTDQLAEERVSGMKGWQQFRFAMGAPDKERRFVKEVKSTAARLQLTYPTLFAWHGSPAKNWHSIIRKGLHFEQTAHGRAYGDGVYHSLQASTSLGYCQYSGGYSYHHQDNTQWPSSVIKVTAAMSLNEIVNAPEEFVSTNPHYVVSKLDWIQTRYLFVKQAFTGEEQSVADALPSREHAQDPRRTPMGESARIVIPAGAIKSTAAPAAPRASHTPAKRKGQGLSGSLVKKRTAGFNIDGTSGDRAIDLDADDDLSDVTDDDDREVLIELGRSGGNRQAEAVAEDQAGDSIRIFSTGSFVPGSLNHDDLPKMQPPSDANIGASKRLQRDFRDLLKVQESTPPAELGWYIDPQEFDNVYQWIVELHSFDRFESRGRPLPLSEDMREAGVQSIVLEMRFPGSYPISPPFVRVIQPRFLGFQQGGGGHVTAGGAMCMELLTNSGWSAVSSIESVLLQVRLAMASTQPRPARLESTVVGNAARSQYSIAEAIDAFKRAVRMHGWTMPPEFDRLGH